MADVRHLVIGGRYENIPAITNFVGEAAAAAGLREAEIFHCQMAVDEACTNVIEHAYGGEGQGEIKVTCVVRPGVCEIQVIDDGEPFDPASVPEPNVNVSVEDIQPGGIGLHLMRQFMDEIHFEFGEDTNRLTMVKRGEAARQAGRAGEIAIRETRPGVWVIKPLGRLDSSAAPALEEALFDLLDRSYEWLIVDMSNVSYIASRGLKSLVSAWRTAHDHGGDVVLCAMSSHVRTVFETVGFTRIFTIHENCDAALGEVSARRT